MEFRYTINEKELSHHGILGMKWGKRQGPPYPLDPEDHSAAEKKAGYKKSIDGGKSDSVKKKPFKSDKANTSQDLNSIAKKLGEKADKVSEKYAKKAYKASSKNTMKVYRKGQKELAKVGEEFLDSYMKNKGVTEVDVNKLNKEYSASVRKAIDAIVQNERDPKSRYYADIQMNKDKSQIERIMLKKSEKN